MHKLAKKLVAIKTINFKALKSSSQKEKIDQEVSILKRFRHPNVIKLYEEFDTPGRKILVTELCAGGDLLNYVRKRRRLKEDYAKYIFQQIIEGLIHIHQKGVLHRDIKLDNILLDGKGTIKIADFGVSHIIRSRFDMIRDQCGTPAYIAPEILRGKGYYGFQADLWSAGVVLYAMIYGTVPFKGATIEDLQRVVLKAKYTLKDNVSPEVRDLIKGLIERNPNKRLNVSEVLQHPWM